MSDLPVATPIDLPFALPIAEPIQAKKPLPIRLYILCAVAVLLVLFWITGGIGPAAKYEVVWETAPLGRGSYSSFADSARAIQQSAFHTRGAFSRGKPTHFGNAIQFTDWFTGEHRVVTGYNISVRKVKADAD